MTDSSRRYSLGKEVDTWDPYDRQGRPPESQSPQATSTPPHIRVIPTHTKTTTRIYTFATTPPTPKPPPDRTDITTHPDRPARTADGSR